MKEGFWPKYCNEDVSWLKIDKHDYIAYPMVCFCDIPLSRIGEHVDFYGKFGLGLTKDWATANNITPIQYIAQNSHIPNTFKDIVAQFSILDQNAGNKSSELLRYLLAHSKPTEGKMKKNGEFITKEFYQESEWRYVPKHERISDCLIPRDFGSSEIRMEKNHISKEHCLLKFSLNSVRYIFVEKDSDISNMVKFIQSELKDQAHHCDLSVLISRITSLESIKRDL